MRIDPYGMRHLPVKQDEMETRASVDMNLKKERNLLQEQRDLEERRRKQEEEDRRQLTEAESKARAAAGGQKRAVRSREENLRFQNAMDTDNLLRQAMTGAAEAYIATRNRMLGKAAEFLKANPQMAGLQSGDGPSFELRGIAANPAWRLGRGAPPQTWDVLACGEQIRLADPRSGQLRSEWDGSRWLGKELTSRFEEAQKSGKNATGNVRIRWTAEFPSLEESALELFDQPRSSLKSASETEALRRYNDEVRRRAQDSLREQPAASGEGARGPVATLGLVGGKLAPVEPKPKPQAAAPPSAAPPARAPGPETKAHFAVLLEAYAFDEASALLQAVSDAELEAAQRGEAPAASLAVDLLKLARDHIQKFGADSAPTLVATSRQVIEAQRRARGPR